MKKYLFFLLYILSNCFAYGQSVNVIQVNENNEVKHSYLVSCIDSLIHDLDWRLQLYIGGETYEYNIEDIDSVSIGKEDVKVFYLPNYIEGTETYFFSNGCAVNISEDSIKGYTIVIDSLDFRANKWDEDKALALYCDSLFRPIMAVTNKGKTQFSYDDIDNTIKVKVVDSDGNIYELSVNNMQDINSVRSHVRRTSTDENRLLNGAKNALDIVNLVRYASQRDMNKIYEVLAPRLIPDGIPKDIILLLKDGIETYFERRVFNKALGLVGVVLDYTQLLSDLRDWIVKQQIGDITPNITNLGQVDNGAVDLRIEFSGDGFLTSTNDAPLFHINYWQEVDGRKVGFTHSTSSQNAHYGFRTERISNLNGGNWAFQVIVYPSRFSVSDFLVANYNFRSNIMRTDMGRIYISELSQTSDYYSENTVTLSMRALLKYQSDEDEVILSAYNDYGLYVKRGNKTPELYSVKQNGGLEFYVNFDFTKNELDLNYNTYKATPKEDIKFGVYTINGYGLRNYYDEQSAEMSYHKVPKAETGDKVSVEKTAAVVKCTYEGCMFWGMPCGIEYGYEGIIERGIVTAEFDGEQEIHLTDLTPGKTYSYRAYYEKDGVPIYGVYKTFKTIDDCTVYTGEVQSKSKDRAEVVCFYYNVPEGAICGVEYSWNGGKDEKRSGSTRNGEHYYTFTGLQPNTTYSYIAFVDVGGQYIYADETKQFTTEEDTDTLSLQLLVGVDEMRYRTQEEYIRRIKEIKDDPSTTGAWTATLETTATLVGNVNFSNLRIWLDIPNVTNWEEWESFQKDNPAFAYNTKCYYGKSENDLTELNYCTTISWSSDKNKKEFAYFTLKDLTAGNYICKVESNFNGKSYSCQTTFNVFVPSNEEYVDLGLSQMWANCNIGANSPEEYGNYVRNFPSTSSLPSSASVKELITNCDMRWGEYKGVQGAMFTGKNGNSIFIPASGYYETFVWPGGWTPDPYSGKGYNCYFWTNTIVNNYGTDYNSVMNISAGRISLQNSYISMSQKGHYPIREVK